MCSAQIDFKIIGGDAIAQSREAEHIPAMLRGAIPMSEDRSSLHYTPYSNPAVHNHECFNSQAASFPDPFAERKKFRRFWFMKRCSIAVRRCKTIQWACCCSGAAQSEVLKPRKNAESKMRRERRDLSQVDVTWSSRGGMMDKRM